MHILMHRTRDLRMVKGTVQTGKTLSTIFLNPKGTQISANTACLEGNDDALNGCANFKFGVE